MSRGARWLGVALVLVTAPQAWAGPAPARLRVVNLVQRTGSIKLAVCRAADGTCRRMTLASDSVSDTLMLAPDRYRFKLTLDGRLASRFTYGVGGGEAYALVLHGAWMPPVRTGWWARLKAVLGGMDARRPRRLRLAHDMVTMRPGKPSDPARVRIANMVPGSRPLAARIEIGTHTVTLPGQPYAGISDSKRFKGGTGRLVERFGANSHALDARDMNFPPGSNTLIYFARLHGARPEIVIDQRLPDTGR